MASKRTVLVVHQSLQDTRMGSGMGLAERRPDYVLGVLIVLATQATFFGPAKYGLLPEITPAHGVGPRQWAYRDEHLCLHHSGDGPRHGHVRSHGTSSLKSLALCPSLVAVAGKGASPQGTHLSHGQEQGMCISSHPLGEISQRAEAASMSAGSG